MIGLTPAQAQCLQAIRDLSVNGVPPTLDEISVRIGCASKSTAHRLVSALKDRGAIGWRRGQARSLYIRSETPAPSPAALENMPPEELRRHIAIASGILAQRTGGGASPGSAAADSRSPARRTANGGLR